MGILPSSKVQAEVGFDVLLPSEDPFYVNGKLCTPESSLFKIHFTADVPLGRK